MCLKAWPSKNESFCARVFFFFQRTKVSKAFHKKISFKKPFLTELSLILRIQRPKKPSKKEENNLLVKLVEKKIKKNNSQFTCQNPYPMRPFRLSEKRKWKCQKTLCYNKIFVHESPAYIYLLIIYLFFLSDS
jgi:hypothetical protein